MDADEVDSVGIGAGAGERDAGLPRGNSEGRLRTVGAAGDHGQPEFPGLVPRRRQPAGAEAGHLAGDLQHRCCPVADGDAQHGVLQDGWKAGGLLLV